MPTNLKVIALISGGKDSFFSMLHCLQNGHEVIALANLHPPEVDSQVPEDNESYMYQTVGHSLIPLYASALDLPLYRQAITGSAVNTSKTYHADPHVAVTSSADEPTAEDETEALIPLLRRIMTAHPTANAISTGAILSDYQRTRVESIALRLGLVPLSYLWQYPFLPPYTQTALLEDIAAVGQDSRIIKVASGGLGEEHLWLNVGEARTVGRLVRGVGRFGGLQGGAVVGEGGEFETVTLDGPWPVWKGRIEVPEGGREVVVGSGGSFSVRIAGARVVEKEDGGSVGEGWRPRVPDVYDTEFAALLARLEERGKDRLPAFKNNPQHYDFLEGGEKSETTVFICNITGADDSNPESTTADQMDRICEKLQAHIRTHNLTTDAISSTTILLRSMSDFAAINKSYGTIFPCPNPPARITISCGDKLPENVQVMLSVTADKCEPYDRRGLHVQSRSYWAPANIGPYSQAIAMPLRTGMEKQTTAELVYVAGQIPLVPASMEIISQDFGQQTVLALQHLWRIGRNMRVGWWSSAVAFVAAASVEEARDRACVAGLAWKLMHQRREVSEDDENDDDDEEDIGYRNLHRPWGASGVSTTDVSTFRSPLPDWERIDSVGDGDVQAESREPYCFVAHVEELPRGALIEWTSLGIAGDSRTSVAQHGGSGFCTVKDVEYCVICINIPTSDEMERFASHFLSKHWHSGILLEIYTAHALAEDLSRKEQVMWVPCKSVWSITGQSLYAAIRIRGYFRDK